MSPQIKDKCAYLDTLAAFGDRGDRGGWDNIDGFFNACLEANVFDDTFRTQSFEFAAKARIRRDLKRGIETKDGQRKKFANVVMKDSQGKTERVYKSEMLLDIGDCVQVVRYWRDRRKYCAKRIKYYTKLAIQLHGSTVQGFLPLRD